jgi:ABC-type sugar transport system ATPase subunit
LFLLDEPTRGLDVGAKTEILKLILELAATGTAVILISSEIEELTRICDRYLILSRGRVIGELPATATQQDLLAAVSGRAETEGATP